MTRIQKPEIIEAVQEAAQDYGVKNLAAELNKAPSTVYAELNPWGDRTQAKLGLEDAVEIMRRSGDVRGLEIAAAECGYRLVPIDGDTLNAENAYAVMADVVTRVGELAGKLRAALDDGDLSRSERLELFDTAAGIMDTLSPFVRVETERRQ